MCNHFIDVANRAPRMRLGLRRKKSRGYDVRSHDNAVLLVVEIDT